MEAPIGEKLSRKYQVRELKDLLTKHGVSGPKGTKSVFVTALLQALTPKQAAEIVSDMRLYVPTDAGQRLVECHFNRIEKERPVAEDEAIELLKAGDVEKCAARIVKFRELLVDPYGARIDWTLGMPQRFMESARYWLKYPFDDLQEPLRRAVAVGMAFAPLWGDSTGGTAKRILRLTRDEFRCEALDRYLASGPSGHIASQPGFDPKEDGAFLYVHTKEFELLGAEHLKGLLEDRVGKGVLVEPGDEYCARCKDGKLQYRWSEMQQLPKLPRHWGCICSYSAWF